MILAYVTTDEVNEGLALQIADECHINMRPLSSGDELAGGRFDAVLFDWDSLPLERRQQVPLDSLAGLSSCPVAVHGTEVAEEEAEALHEDGVAVFRRLEPKVFKSLRQLAKRSARPI